MLVIGLFLLCGTLALVVALNHDHKAASWDTHTTTAMQLVAKPDDESRRYVGGL